MRTLTMISLMLSLLCSCTVTENGAKRRIQRHSNGIEKLVKMYPHLADSTTTVTKEIMILPELTGIENFDVPVNTESFDNVLRDFLAVNRELDLVEAEIKKISKPNWTNIDKEEQLASLKKRHNELMNSYDNQRLLLHKGAYQDTTFVTEDDLFKFVVKFTDGKINLTYTKKEQKIEYDKSVTKVSINTSQKFNWKSICVGALAGAVIAVLIVLRIMR